MKRLVKDVFYRQADNHGLKVTQPVIVFRVRGYHKVLNPPKPQINLTNLGMQPLKLGF